MCKYLFLFLSILCISSGCNKETSSQKLYMRSLNQIKKSLKGSWELRSICNTTITGTKCHDVENEFLVFADKDSLLWIKENEIIKKDKIEFKRIKAPAGYGYKTDSVYVFRFANENGFYLPYDIVHDSLTIRDAISAIDAGFGLTLTRKQ